MATFTDIVNRVIANTGRSDKTTTIQARVSDAITEIQRLHSHYFMEEVATRPIVVDEGDYLVPTDFKDIKTIYLQNSDGTWRQPPLGNLSMEEAREKWNALDEGDPEDFSVFRRALFVWPPKPKDATKKLLLEYWKYMPTISGTETNELTLVWPDLLEAWASWKFYMTLPGAEDMVKHWQPLATAQHQTLIKYSNDYRLKARPVMALRDTVRLYPQDRSRVFGGR